MLTSILLSSSTLAQSTTASEWQQCGGIGFTGPTTCDAGLQCVKQNDYYSQCMASASGPSSTGTVSEWQQCGGTGFTGPTTCAPGLQCVKQNDAYSQCLQSSPNSSTDNTTIPVSSNGTSTGNPDQNSTSTTTTVSVLPTPVGTYNTTTTNVKSMPGPSGVGKTTRYWDCCKPSCSWDANVVDVSGSVQTCKADGVSIAASTFMSGCQGGDAYSCSNNQPFAVNDQLAYGYAAASIAGLDLKGGCCQCFKLDFTSGPVVGKSMIVQVTNTGTDLSENHFDLQIPGGGVGIFDGCSSQWKIDKSLWGQQYGGISTLAECKNLPKELQSGCEFRYGWFMNADNPTMKFERVACPAEIVKNTGCQKKDEL